MTAEKTFFKSKKKMLHTALLTSVAFLGLLSVVQIIQIGNLSNQVSGGVDMCHEQVLKMPWEPIHQDVEYTFLITESDGVKYMKEESTHPCHEEWKRSYKNTASRRLAPYHIDGVEAFQDHVQTDGMGTRDGNWEQRWG